jgi:hypothetical protein
MPTYKLQPIDGLQDHSDWRDSILPPTPVWLRAINADHARQRIHLATSATDIMPGEVIKAPWVNAALVNCTEDEAHIPPVNAAVFANGKITLKLP